MLENAPQLSQNDLSRLILNKEYKENSDMNILIDKINEGYEYWDFIRIRDGYQSIDDYVYAENSVFNYIEQYPDYLQLYLLIFMINFVRFY